MRFVRGKILGPFSDYNNIGRGHRSSQREEEIASEERFPSNAQPGKAGDQGMGGDGQGKHGREGGSGMERRDRWL